ncbi:MAG: hypothetical protein JNM02_06900 [Anaerolineales bacterium]|nr:hypothetical protein [Anaerolineales bacterium]
MEILLAIVVASAVILLGALISMGNERQRKAIDGLREQMVLWAMQDLRIKRERLARDVQVDDPLAWLNKVAARACGYDLNLQVIESVESPNGLICAIGNGRGKTIFSPLAPGEIRSLNRTTNNRLSQFANQNPLLFLPRKVAAFECSVLNNGILFDLELPLVWKSLTGHNIEEIGLMWMYIIP